MSALKTNIHQECRPRVCSHGDVVLLKFLCDSMANKYTNYSNNNCIHTHQQCAEGRGEMMRSIQIKVQKWWIRCTSKYT